MLIRTVGGKIYGSSNSKNFIFKIHAEYLDSAINGYLVILSERQNMTVVILLLSVYHPLQKSVGCNPKGQSRFSKILRFLGLFLYQLAFLSTKTVRSTAFFLVFFF